MAARGTKKDPKKPWCKSTGCDLVNFFKHELPYIIFLESYVYVALHVVLKEYSIILLPTAYLSRRN